MDTIEKTEIFLSIIQANKGIIYKVANMYCNNVEDRQDLFQEIVIQLWKSLDNFDDRFKHSTWIYRISLNVAISFYRKENNRRKMTNSLADGILHLPDDDLYENKETDLNILQQMISQLKDLDKALILLYLEEKSHKEIAQIIGISETNIATKINRIKNNFKEKFHQLKNK